MIRKVLIFTALWLTLIVCVSAQGKNKNACTSQQIANEAAAQLTFKDKCNELAKCLEGQLTEIDMAHKTCHVSHLQKYGTYQADKYINLKSVEATLDVCLMTREAIFEKYKLRERQE